MESSSPLTETYSGLTESFAGVILAYSGSFYINNLKNNRSACWQNNKNNQQIN